MIEEYFFLQKSRSTDGIYLAEGRQMTLLQDTLSGRLQTFSKLT